MTTILTRPEHFAIAFTLLLTAAATSLPAPAHAAARQYGPHGGDLQPAGEHRVELTFHNGRLELNIYKADKRTPVAIPATRLTALVTIPGKKGQRRVTLSADPQPDEKRSSSRFAATAAYLKSVKQIEATVGLAINRKPHRLSFVAQNRKPEPAGRRKTVTFYGVEFQISVSTPQAVLDQLSQRMEKAVKDENAGNLEPALKQMRQIRADLPDDVASSGLDEAIERVEGKMKTKGAAANIDQRIAAAIQLANEEKYAEALAALQKIKKDLPKDVKAPGLDAAIAEIKQKLAEKN